MSELLRSGLGIVYWDRGSSVVILRRSSRPVIDDAEMVSFLDRLDLLLPVLRRKTLGLLLDMREGPMRNDPEYEQRLHRSVVRLVAGFRRVAILMQTSMGLLQASRLRRERGLLSSEPHPFLSEADALAYLTEPDRVA